MGRGMGVENLISNISSMEANMVVVVVVFSRRAMGREDMASSRRIKGSSRGMDSSHRWDISNRNNNNREAINKVVDSSRIRMRRLRPRLRSICLRFCACVRSSVVLLCK